MGSLWYLLVIIDWLALIGFCVGLLLAAYSDNDKTTDAGVDLLKGSLWVFGIDSVILLLYAFIIQLIAMFYGL